jgi:uncharacterized protein YlzI (FlbEa/FlbD family)
MSAGGVSMGLARLTQAATSKTVFVNPDDVLDVYAIPGGTQINMSKGRKIIVRENVVLAVTKIQAVTIQPASAHGH